MEYLETAKEAGEAAFSRLKQELSGIRTGRANPMLVEDIQVEAYDSKQPMKNVATITTPDARTIMIAPWDKTLLAIIEKAITISNRGLNPVNDGVVLRVPIPVLTEETRKELVKTIKDKIEAARIRIRKERDEIRSKIAKLQKDGEISEDQKFSDFDKLDEIVKDYNQKIEQTGKEKEGEIMKV